MATLEDLLKEVEKALLSTYEGEDTALLINGKPVVGLDIRIEPTDGGGLCADLITFDV